MPINTKLESLVAFKKAGSSFRDGRRKSNATLHRWRLSGVNGVKLETCLIGGLRYTSLEAIDRFIAAQNPDEASPPAITPAQRRRQSEAAAAELERIGVSRCSESQALKSQRRATTAADKGAE